MSFHQSTASNQIDKPHHTHRETLSPTGGMQIYWDKFSRGWVVVVVKRSAYQPSTPTTRVRIPLTSTVFSVKFLLEMNENKQKRSGLAHFKVQQRFRIDRLPNQQNIYFLLRPKLGKGMPRHLNVQLFKQISQSILLLWFSMNI